MMHVWLSDAFVFIAAAQDLAGFYMAIPFHWKLACHCLVVASWFTRNKNKFLLSYWTGFLGAFGGGILSALVLQSPQRAGIALFEDNMVGWLWTLAWWGINYFPGDLVNQIHSALPVRMITRAGMNMLRAGIIAARIDTTELMFPGVAAAPLFVGTIAAAGGKLLVDLIQQLSGELKGASEVVEPGFPLRTAFFGSALYWGSVYQLGMLKPAEGMALVTTIFILHGVVSDVIGVPGDFTAPIARVLHAVLNVPMPSAASSARQPKVAAAKKTK